MSNEDYSKFPLPTPLNLTDEDSKLDEIDLNNKNEKQILVEISKPKLSPNNNNQILDASKNRNIKKNTKRKRHTSYINLRLIKSNIDKWESHAKDNSIYFGCIAPMKSNYIDMHCNKISELDLNYCCGLYMKIDQSFIVHTLLSNEFITALKEIVINIEKKRKQQIYSPPYFLVNKIEKKEKDNELEDETTAYHPKDHWIFAKDMEYKQIIIFIHGQQYSPDIKKSCEYVLNECIDFCKNIPYLIIPFLWPCEGELLIYDESSTIEEMYLASELASFAKRLWSLFERIDFVGHGKGCNIMFKALDILLKEKPDIIDVSHVISIAPDMPLEIFKNHIKNIKNNVKRLTLYTNTWDWKLFSSKWWNWSSSRAGASIYLEKGLDTIDTTNLLGYWTESNHYYLTNEFFKNDIIQALSKTGGLHPRFRNYVLPKNDYYTYNKYYELVDKPYRKADPNKQEKDEKKEENNDENDKKNEEIIDKSNQNN